MQCCFGYAIKIAKNTEKTPAVEPTEQLSDRISI